MLSLIGSRAAAAKATPAGGAGGGSLRVFLFVALALLTAGQATAQDLPAPEDLPPSVETPAGFEATLFAAPPQVSYPTAITAAGTAPGALFIATDRNGSLGQERGRGQVVRAADTDGDGRADEFTAFVDSVESPRGLVYDGETLYVMHPPALTAYRDTDGDGRADEARPLIEGLGFGLDFRGADHTTNGIQMGIDGWIYVAVGDYGFTEAVGADGTQLTHRGGAIVRVRPDGSGLELVASGLRNVYDIALDPYLNGFVRGNTNDGGGWDVRLNRIFLGADYGYPNLFKNFSDEVMPPLADYGGGSGTGAYFLHEPGVPDSLNDVLYTADWGRSAVYRHPMKKQGASFAAQQKAFMRLPAPTDLTADSRSHLYVSSWYRGGFRYTNENVGFIARLAPAGQERPSQEPPSEAAPGALVDLLGSASAVHRLQAQREILRRGTPGTFTSPLEDMAGSAEAPLYARVAAVFTLKQLLGTRSHAFLLRLAEDESEVQAFALRALADREDQLGDVPARPFVEALDEARPPRTRLEAVTGLARLDAQDAAEDVFPLAAAPDSVLAHIATQVLVDLNAAPAALDALDAPAPPMRAAALRVLKQLHTQPAVEGLLAKAGDETDPEKRDDLLEALARLYHQEGEWERDDWWGTQPDTHGPYYNPVTWAQSDAIRPALRDALLQTGDGRAPDSLLARFERNRALPVGTRALVSRVSQEASALRPDLKRALVGHADVPQAAMPLLEQLSQRSDSLQASVARLLLAQRDDALPPEGLALLRGTALAEALPSGLRGEVLATLEVASASTAQGRDEAVQAFAALGDPGALSEDLAETWRRFAQRAEHVEAVGYFTDLAQSENAAEQTLAYAVLLEMAHAGDDRGDGEGDDRSATEKQAQQEARSALADGWDAENQTPPLLRAIGYTEAETYADRVQALLEKDEPLAADVREAAAFAAQRLGLAGASESSQR